MPWPRWGKRGSVSKPNYLLRVAGEYFFPYIDFGDESADEGDLLGTRAFVAFTDRVGAVGSQTDFVLVAVEESGALLLVAAEGVVPGARREIAVDVGIVGEQFIRQAARGDLAFGVHGLLVVVFVHVAPPGLGVADKSDRGIFFEHFVEAFEAQVVGVVLDVHQHRHIEFLGDLVDELHLLRVTLEMEFLLTDAPGVFFEPLFDGGLCLGQVRHFVAKVDELVRVFGGECRRGFIAGDFCRESVGTAVAGGGAIDRSTGWQQHGLCDAHGVLVF